MIRAVVFDFGGVLITSISNQVATVAARHGVEPTLMHDVLLGPRASDVDHPWHRAERGELDIVDIQPQLDPWAQRAGIELHGDEIERLLTPGGYTVVDEMTTAIRGLRADGCRTALLTNTFAEFRPTMQRDIDFALFDVIVESFAVGARKPEGHIYDVTADRLGVAPGEIVYLDDFDQNLEPAAQRGWTTILVDDPVRAVSELIEMLVSPDFDST